MKKIFILILGGLLLYGQAFSQTAEQETLKKICIGEAQAYEKLDYNTWASYHVQSADEQLSWNNPDGSFGTQLGWDAISNGMKEWFGAAKKENLKTTSDNFNFIIRGDMAFVSYSSSSLNEAGKTMKKRDFKTLLKSKGQWKILAIESYADHASVK